MIADEKAVMEEAVKPWAQGRYNREGWKDFTTAIFMPATPITVEIQVGEKLNPRHHPVSNVVYKLRLIHGSFEWTISRRFKDFTLLHTKLALYRASENFRTGVARGFRDIFPQNTIPTLPRFPGRPDTMMTSVQHLEERRGAMQTYMNDILSLNFFRESNDLIEFLEVSPYSFQEGSIKGKEGWLKKRHGDDNLWKLAKWREYMLFHDVFSAQISTNWSKRWVIIQESYLMYVNSKTGTVKCVLLFDKNFDFSVGFRSAGSRRCLLLSNMSRNLYLKCSSKRSAKETFQFIKETLSERAALDYTTENPHGSYAPPRVSRGQWFVDGQGYMDAVATGIEQAREEIFITDWWLSPDLCLKRETEDREKWRLFKLLRSQADLGVQISILLYKEVAAFLAINSVYSKQKLIKHKNIRVIRHPDHSPIPSMWAHHEKMVIIDQELVFTGGIDLCYGRWDNQSHRLTDLLPSGPQEKSDSVDTPTTSPTRVNIVNSTRPLIAGVKSVTALLLQQHSVLDVAIGPALQTLNLDVVAPKEPPPPPSPEPVRIDQKNFKNSAQGVLLRMRTMKKMKISKDCDRESVKSLKSPVSDETLSPVHSPSPNLHLYKWPGKDYVNWIVKDIFNAEQADQDNADRQTTPRMPWHDIGAAFVGQTARDAARHFIQRWNSVKREKLKQDKLNKFPLIVPKKYCGEMNEYYSRILPASSDIDAQVVRSCSYWSAGQMETEASIHAAMVDCIRAARHYVYIENQFFITFVHKKNEVSEVHNDIANALFERIMRAHKEGETFRVFILLPLLPALEGDVAGETGYGMRTIMHYQYSSISRNQTSIINRLEKQGIQNWSDYIGFYSLRGKDELQGVPVSELIYIHSKLIIVDDNRAIISSGNINDRSLLGDRDSEFGVLIRDKEFTKGLMNGAEYKSGKFCGSLRRSLFSEHLGIQDEEQTNIKIDDPVSDTFYSLWQNTAKENTSLFEELFSVLPSDNISTRKDSKLLQTSTRPLVETFSLTKTKLNRIQGTLVEYPLWYLKDENLAPPLNAKEGMVSSHLWT